MPLAPGADEAGLEVGDDVGVLLQQRPELGEALTITEMQSGLVCVLANLLVPGLALLLAIVARIRKRYL